jgi:hypothetical protein
VSNTNSHTSARRENNGGVERVVAAGCWVNDDQWGRLQFDGSGILSTAGHFWEIAPTTHDQDFPSTVPFVPCSVKNCSERARNIHSPSESTAWVERKKRKQRTEGVVLSTCKHVSSTFLLLSSICYNKHVSRYELLTGNDTTEFQQHDASRKTAKC